jgi:hypothetical protein
MHFKTIIPTSASTPPLTGDLNESCWKNAAQINIDKFRQESSDHHPKTKVYMLYDTNGLHLLFKVNDQYVRSVQTELHSPVCTDSCVEFFVQPKPNHGYLNFETNCGGTLLTYYIEDWRKTDTGFVKYTPLPAADAELIKIYHAMPNIVDPEITEPTKWINQLFIPFSLVEKYVGKLGPVAGQSWRGNFYKSADNTSHPHWAAWSPVSKLNFHLPECFGTLNFR